MARRTDALIAIFVFLAGWCWAVPAALADSSSSAVRLPEQDRLEREVERLETMLELEQQTANRRERRLDTAVRQLEALRHERNRAETDRRASRLMIERLRAELEAAGQRLRRREVELTRTKTELARLRETADTGPVAAAVEAPADPPGKPPRLAEVQAALDHERSRRILLERELQRVLTQPSLNGEVRALMQSLEAARAEILVLTNALDAERRRHEALEVAVERLRLESDLPDASPQKTLRHFSKTMRARRSEARRLERELLEAREEIVRLRGRLEALSTSGEPAAGLSELEEENRNLQKRLQEVEAIRERLQSQAALAERLADLLYGSGL